MAKATAKNTRRRLTKRDRSAVSTVVQSGFELVPRRKRTGKLATIRYLAKVDWKPWKRDKGLRKGELLPRHGDFERCYVPCRFAHAIMLMERKDLIAMHGKIEHDYVDQLMGSFAETAEWLKYIVQMLDMAYLRTLASASAHQIAGGKFKGVSTPRRRMAR